MDIQDYLTAKVSQMRAEELKHLPVITLGELIAKLEAIPLKHHRDFDNSDDDVKVIFDFPDQYPTILDSWRGVYAELAMGYCDNEEKLLKDLLADCKSAVGKEFSGYKGGEFVMGKSTPIWVANYGDSGNTAIVDVIHDSSRVILVTSYIKS